MPKPFTIGVEIEEFAVIAVVRKINKLKGVIKLHMDLDKETKTNGTGKPRGNYEGSGQEAMAGILHGKPPMTTGQLKGAFKELGRSPASIASVLHTMQANGEIKRTGDGYTLTPKMRDRLRHRIVAAKSVKK